MSAVTAMAGPGAADACALWSGARWSGARWTSTGVSSRS